MKVIIFFSMMVFIYQTHYLCHFFFFLGGSPVDSSSGSCSSGFGCSSLPTLSLVVVVSALLEFGSTFSSFSSTFSSTSAPSFTLHFDRSHLGRACRRLFNSASQSSLEQSLKKSQ